MLLSFELGVLLICGGRCEEPSLVEADSRAGVWHRS